MLADPALTMGHAAALCESSLWQIGQPKNGRYWRSWPLVRCRFRDPDPPLSSLLEPYSALRRAAFLAILSRRLCAASICSMASSACVWGGQGRHSHSQPSAKSTHLFFLRLAALLNTLPVSEKRLDRFQGRAIVQGMLPSAPNAQLGRTVLVRVLLIKHLGRNRLKSGRIAKLERIYARVRPRPAMAWAPGQRDGLDAV